MRRGEVGFGNGMLGQWWMWNKSMGNGGKTLESMKPKVGICMFTRWKQGVRKNTCRFLLCPNLGSQEGSFL